MSNKVISLDSIKVACSNCSLATLCFPYSLQADDIERLDNIIQRNRPIQRGHMLFKYRDPLKNLYVIKTGAVKIYTQNDMGDEQVIGFHLPGEILGLDAIQHGSHSCYAKALETTAVCEIPFTELEKLAAHIPSLQHQMLRLLSREINEEARLISLLNNGTAEQRLASFLISLSERFKRRGFSATDFFLSMSRQEIGSYLGLALETVSRLFTRFQDDGILQVERKHVQITDLERLHGILKHQAECTNKINYAS
jgi:CRP/FNR family transcriptional regulator